jgi:hypothetical protein
MIDARPILRRRTKRRHQPLPAEILIPRQSDRCIIGTSEVSLEMSPGSVQTHNHSLIEVLTKVRRQVNATNSINLDPAFFEEVMRDLRTLGLSAYTSLGADFVAKFDRLAEKAGEPGLALTIKGDAFPLLWEMLYTGSSRGTVYPEKFWGFQHQLTRFKLGADSMEEAELDPATDFLFCHHHQLHHCSLEREAVQMLVAPHFKFYMLEEAFARNKLSVNPPKLSEQFIDLLDMLELGMLHLACHCLANPDQTGVLFSELVLSYQTTLFHLKLHELKAAQRDFGFSLKPLVFLNACKTMTNPEHLIQGDSFPGGFLHFGASGVVATACDVPDLFAKEFAAIFYQNLCVDIGGRSPTVSEALLKTRQHFINPPNYNPLGLAYGLYARNELHIEWDPWAGSLAGGSDA